MGRATALLTFCSLPENGGAAPLPVPSLAPSVGEGSWLWVSSLCRMANEILKTPKCGETGGLPPLNTILPKGVFKVTGLPLKGSALGCSMSTLLV